MFNIVLFEPQIPQNTGSIARTCAVTGSTLHLIRPYGFSISERQLKRAGLDYWSRLKLAEYSGFEEFLDEADPENLYPVSTKGSAAYSDFSFNDGDFFLFGSETSGLPERIHEAYPDSRIRIPMLDIKEARCLNLANSAAIILYEALRQCGYLNLK